MRRTFTFGSVTLVLFVALYAFGQGSSGKQSVAQVTGPNSGISCSGPSGTYADSDLSLTFYSSGSPIIVSFSASANLSTNQGIQLRPTIDGLPPDPMTVGHFVGDADSISLSFTRAYAVPKGLHTYTLQSSCQGSVGIGNRWLMVQETN